MAPAAGRPPPPAAPPAQRLTPGPAALASRPRPPGRTAGLRRLPAGPVSAPLGPRPPPAPVSLSPALSPSPPAGLSPSRRPPSLAPAAPSLPGVSPLRVSARLPPRLCPSSFSPSRSRRAPPSRTPAPPPLRPRLAREPALPPPAAPRTPNSAHAAPFARLSPLLARDPHPAAGAAPPPPPRQPRSPRRPTGPGPGPPPWPRGRQAPSHPPVARGWGLRGPAPALDPVRVFLLPPGALLPEPIPIIRSRAFQPPRGRWRGFLCREGSGWDRVGAGFLGAGPLPSRRTLCTPLLLEGPSQSPRAAPPILQTGRLSTEVPSLPKSPGRQSGPAPGLLFSASPLLQSVVYGRVAP